jgi:hypothetical protein
MKGCILAGRFVFSNAAKNTVKALRKTDAGPSGKPRKPREGS